MFSFDKNRNVTFAKDEYGDVIAIYLEPYDRVLTDGYVRRFFKYLKKKKSMFDDGVIVSISSYNIDGLYDTNIGLIHDWSRCYNNYTGEEL